MDATGHNGTGIQATEVSKVAIVIKGCIRVYDCKLANVCIRTYNGTLKNMSPVTEPRRI